MAKQTPSPGENYGTHVGKWDANDAELYTLYALLGMAVSSVNFGVFTGSTLSDNEDAKTLFQQLETALELPHGENILTDNGTYTGKTMTVVIDDASAVFGNALYCEADFHYERCDADIEAVTPCVCLALEAGVGSKLVLLEGQICNTSWNWSAGPIYMSTAIGELTQAIPSGPGDQVQRIGFALSADTIYFRPDSTVIEQP